jgi:hypothetical protein
VRIVSAAIRDEPATTQTDPFQANPEGRWCFGRFSALLAPDLRISVCSSLFALKIGQIADGGMSPTDETMY